MIKRTSLHVVVGLLAVALVSFPGCGGSGDAPSRTKSPISKKSQGRKPSKDATAPVGPALEPPEISTVLCRIYTPEPGFRVLVDGVEARLRGGQLLETPCEIGIPSGNHVVMVVKKGYPDVARDISVDSPESFVFEHKADPFAVAAGYWTSRFAGANVGDAVSLDSVNQSGRAFDPYLTPDSKTIYFAGDRNLGKGIYRAQRESQWDEFGEPELVRTTRGSSLPVSPFVNTNEDWLVFTTLESGEMWGCFKEGDDFGSRRELSLPDEGEEPWNSVWISEDGRTAYATRGEGGDATTWVVTRRSEDDPFPDEWRQSQVPVPASCLSQDGLRLFAYDGSELKRSSRLAMDGDWSKPEVIAKFAVEHYRNRGSYRQFWVTDDEQWLYYSRDPESGNLYAARIHAGPRWGYVPTGKRISDDGRPLAETDTPTETPADMPTTESAKPEVDPRALPLPLVTYQNQLAALFTQWKFDEALKLITESRQKPEFSKDGAILDADQDEVEAARDFVQLHLLKAVEMLKPGDDVRMGPARLKFQAFDPADSGQVEGTVNKLTVKKPLREFPGTDLVQLAELAADRTSETFQYRAGVFLARCANVSPQSITTRLSKAGVRGRQFQERQQMRLVAIIERELDRDNVEVCLKLIGEAVAAAPKSTGATAALAMKEKLYSRIEWRPAGRRKWATPAPGEFIGGAPAGKSAKSMLVSSRLFGNFILSLEFRTQGGVQSQGGVYFRYDGTSDITETAYKLHVANDANGPVDKFSSGSLLGIQAPTQSTIKPEGEWNTLVLRVENENISATINGVEVLKTVLTDPKIKERGLVCLDGEYLGISYRKVLIYEIMPKPKK